MNRVARSPGSAAPLSAAIRSDDVSYMPRTSGASSRTRCSMTGTANTVTSRWEETARSVCSGSNRRCRTTGARSAHAICIAAYPQVWNSGASTIIVWRERSGIRDVIEASGHRPGRGGRRAPLGRRWCPS